MYICIHVYKHGNVLYILHVYVCVWMYMCCFLYASSLSTWFSMYMYYTLCMHHLPGSYEDLLSEHPTIFDDISILTGILPLWILFSIISYRNDRNTSKSLNMYMYCTCVCTIVHVHCTWTCISFPPSLWVFDVFAWPFCLYIYA